MCPISFLQFRRLAAYGCIFTKHDFLMGEDPIVAVIPTIFAVTGDRVKGRPLKAFAWSDARASQRYFTTLCPLCGEVLLAHQKVIFNFQTTSEVYYDMLDMSRAKLSTRWNRTITWHLDAYSTLSVVRTSRATITLT